VRGRIRVNSAQSLTLLRPPGFGRDSLFRYPQPASVQVAEAPIRAPQAGGCFVETGAMFDSTDCDSLTVMKQVRKADSVQSELIYAARSPICPSRRHFYLPRISTAVSAPRSLTTRLNRWRMTIAFQGDLLFR